MVRYPGYLYLLLIPAMIIPVLVGRYRHSLKTLQSLYGSWRSDSLREMYLVKYFFAGLGVIIVLVTLILGLAGFQGKKRMDITDYQGTDIVFAMDISRSMLCEDVEPSRLMKAAGIASGIVERTQGARFAVVIFKGDGVRTIPMTEDARAVTGFLTILDPSLLSSPGSNAEAALRRAMEAFGDIESRRKIIMLFTDGESLSGNPVDAAAAAAVEEITIITVGAGTPEGGPIPLQTGGSVLDSAGREVITKMRPDILEQIASRSGGAYLHITDPGFFARVASLTETESRKPVFRSKEEDVYRTFLLAALGGFCIFLLVKVKRWKNMV